MSDKIAYLAALRGNYDAEEDWDEAVAVYVADTHPELASAGLELALKNGLIAPDHEARKCLADIIANLLMSSQVDEADVLWQAEIMASRSKLAFFSKVYPRLGKKIPTLANDQRTYAYGRSIAEIWLSGKMDETNPFSLNDLLGADFFPVQADAFSRAILKETVKSPEENLEQLKLLMATDQHEWSLRMAETVRMGYPDLEKIGVADFLDEWKRYERYLVNYQMYKLIASLLKLRAKNEMIRLWKVEAIRARSELAFLGDVFPSLRGYVSAVASDKLVSAYAKQEAAVWLPEQDFTTHCLDIGCILDQAYYGV